MSDTKNPHSRAHFALSSRAAGLHHAAMVVWGEKSHAMREDLDFGLPPTLMSGRQPPLASRAVGLLVASVATASKPEAADFMLRVWGPPFAEEEAAEHRRRVNEVVEGCVQPLSLDDVIREALAADELAHKPKLDQLMAEMQARYDATPDGGPAVFGNPPNLRAAEELAHLMSEISENCYCAGWLMGLEYTLWNFATDPSTRLGTDWGQDSVSEGEIKELRRLSAECDGWIVWDEQHPTTKTCIGETWVPLDKWLTMWRRGVQRIADDGQPVPEGKNICVWCGHDIITEERTDSFGSKIWWHGCKACGRHMV